MFDLKDYKTFLDKNKRKNIFSALKTVQGVNVKAIKKIALLNGKVSLTEKALNTNPEFFNNLKNQAGFFYSLEENKIFNNVNRKKRLKNYSGMRHILRLPVRGQRTHTNSKTPRKNIKKEV